MQTLLLVHWWRKMPHVINWLTPCLMPSMLIGFEKNNVFSFKYEVEHTYIWWNPSISQTHFFDRSSPWAPGEPGLGGSSQIMIIVAKWNILHLLLSSILTHMLVIWALLLFFSITNWQLFLGLVFNFPLCEQHTAISASFYAHDGPLFFNLFHQENIAGCLHT